jgi:hypothetical protein
MNKDIDLEEYAPMFVIILTVVGGILRVFLLGNKVMWLDETFSVWLANHSVADMLHWMVKLDQHPPLYYLLLHYWIALEGDGPGAVRLLSAIFSTATIPIVYLIGKRMSSKMMGVAAAVILAFSPFNIRFAQDARMYTLLAFNAAVAIYALVRLLTDPRSTRPIGSQFREYVHAWRTLGPVERDPKEGFSYQEEVRNQTRWGAWIYRHRWSPLRTVETDLAWILFIVFSAATLLTHNTAVLFILAINIFVLGLMLFQRIKKPGSPPGMQATSLGNWVKSQIAIFLLWSPWIVAFIQQVNRVYQEFWVPKPTWGSVTWVLGSFLNEDWLIRPSQVLLSWILYTLVLCLGLVYFRKNLVRFLFLAALFAIPFLGELIVSIRRPIFLDRTLIWITIPLFLVVAAGIAQLRFRVLIILVLGILATNNLFSASDYYKFIPNEDWKSATSDVVAFAEKGDLVLFNAGWIQIPFDYYFKTFNPYSNQVQNFMQVEKHGVPVDMFDRGILEPKMTYSDVPGLISMLQGHKRVWLVYSHYSYTDPLGLVPQTLASQMKLIREDDYYGVRVLLYATP